MSITFNGEILRTTRGDESSTMTCKVVDTSWLDISSPSPGILVMEIRHVRDGEDCKDCAEERGTSTKNSPPSPNEPSLQISSPSKTSTKIPMSLGTGISLPS